MTITDTEELVLCTVLKEPDSMRILAPELVPDRFADGARRLLYATMLDMYIAKIPIDATTLLARLGKKAPAAGGHGYLLTLLDKWEQMGVNSARGLPEWTRIVDTAGQLRNLAKVVDEYHHLLENFELAMQEAGSDPGQFVADFMSKLQQAKGRVKTDARPVQEAVEEMKRRLQADLEGRSVSVLDCGMPSLFANRFLPMASLVVISAISSMGKTSLMLQIALGTAIKLRENNLPGMVSISELEMPSWKLVRRMASALACVEYARIETGAYRPDSPEVGRFMEAADFISTLPLVINDDGGQTSTGIMLACDALNIQCGPLWLHCSDYLELLKDRADSEELRVSGIARNHQFMARRSGACVILLSQLHNEVFRTPDKVAGMGGLRYSGAIGQAADVVAEIWNGPQMLMNGIDWVLPKDKGITNGESAWVLMEKYRDGATGAFPLGWNRNITGFHDPALRALKDSTRLFNTSLFYDYIPPPAVVPPIPVADDF